MIKAFKVVYTFLALNFIIPALYYAISPEGAVGLFAGLGMPFGVTEFPFTEDSMFWRVLGIGNVATLGFCCVLLLKDLKKNYPILVPLVFLKGMSIAGFALAYATHHHPSFLVAVLFDGITVLSMIFFARGAHKEMIAMG